MRVRRSRHLISYWTDQGNIVCNYATGESVLADSLVSHVLSLCTDWTSDADLRKQLARISRKEVDALVASMVKHSLLVRADRAADARERALDTWSHWNPAAGFFH